MFFLFSKNILGKILCAKSVFRVSVKLKIFLGKIVFWCYLDFEKLFCIANKILGYFVRRFERSLRWTKIWQNNGYFYEVVKWKNFSILCKVKVMIWMIFKKIQLVNFEHFFSKNSGHKTSTQQRLDFLFWGRDNCIPSQKITVSI